MLIAFSSLLRLLLASGSNKTTKKSGIDLSSGTITLASMSREVDTRWITSKRSALTSLGIATRRSNGFRCSQAQCSQAYTMVSALLSSDSRSTRQLTSKGIQGQILSRSILSIKCRSLCLSAKTTTSATLCKLRTCVIRSAPLSNTTRSLMASAMLALHSTTALSSSKKSSISSRRATTSLRGNSYSD